MKMIKFRGKDENTGKYVYGDLCNMSSVISTPSIINEHGNRIFVDPDTVAQFVGYDKNKKEVYEGDKLTDKYGHILTARLRPQAVCNNEHIRFDWMPDSCDFELKENC